MGPRRNARGKRMERRRASPSRRRWYAYAAVAGEDRPFAGAGRKTRGERGDLRMNSQCRHRPVLVVRSSSTQTSGVSDRLRPHRCGQQPGQNDSLWRRAAAASNRPMPGAGAALFLTIATFSRKHPPGERLSRFRPAIFAGLRTVCAPFRVRVVRHSDVSAHSCGTTTIISE